MFALYLCENYFARLFTEAQGCQDKSCGISLYPAAFIVHYRLKYGAVLECGTSHADMQIGVLSRQCLIARY